MNQPYSPQPHDTESNAADSQTQRIRIPAGWYPEQWGGWSYCSGAHLSDGLHNLDFFMRPNDDDWTLWVTTDRVDHAIVAPVSVSDANNVQVDFWPDCIEDLQALLLQIGRYGHARPAPDGWAVEAMVTAAAARAAVAANSGHRLVNRGAAGSQWVFADTGTAVPAAVDASSDAPLGPSSAPRASTSRGDRGRGEPSTRNPVATSAAGSQGKKLQRPGTAGTRHEALARPRSGGLSPG